MTPNNLLSNMSIKACIFCIVVFMCTVKVNSQVCINRTIVTLTTQETYSYRYKEYYETKCWFGRRCTKTRMKTNIDYRVVPIRRVKVIQTCCAGYIRDDDASTDDKIVCKASCPAACQNGNCRFPGICVCNEGYSFHAYNNPNCVPECPNGCDHGFCKAPDVCECNYGYSFNETCQPICTEPCINGYCTAPGTCECLVGYRKSENNTCEPYCSKGCGSHATCVNPETCSCEDGYDMVDEDCLPICDSCNNGTCVAPNKCECNFGFDLVNDTICEPVCPNGCENGYCDAPNTCECNPGFELQLDKCQPSCNSFCGHGACVAPETCQCEPGYVYNSSCEPSCCEPFCTKPCIHGSCVGPDICQCDLGYTKDFILDVCVPECPLDCGYGICIAPGTCECNPGYAQKDAEEYDYYSEPICEPICRECEGECVSPFTCVCNDNIFEARNETEGGDDCDCFDNCNETSIPCVRTVCIPKGTTSTIQDKVTSSTRESKDDGESKIYLYDHYYVDSTSETLETFINDENSSTTESERNTNETHVSSNIGNKQQQNKHSSIPSVWIYVAIGIIATLIITMIFVVFFKRKALLHLLRGGSYVVEEKTDNVSSPSIDMKFIAEKKTT